MCGTARRQEVALKNLLKLQELDLEIEKCLEREKEIPKRKTKLEVQIQRLRAELEERHKKLKDLQLEQRTLEKDIEQVQNQIQKYQQQLLSVKKNEEYQALLHEIETLKKQISLKEERIISLMMEIDEAKVSLAEDEKRIQNEIKGIEKEFSVIDEELAKAVRVRKEKEAQRSPQAALVEPDLLAQYERFRSRKKSALGVVPLRGEHCSGCNMAVPPQLVNEVLAGKVRACNHCGRILYSLDKVERNIAPVTGEMRG
jgi:predicted  nucleic acid-binding Zn-ribbon protein